MKHVITIFILLFVIILISIFGATLYVKLVANTVSETALYRQTIAFGMVIFIIILSGTFVAIKYVDIYRDKQLETYLGSSELLRIVHNEIKRYNGDEIMYLANDENLILLLSEISSLYKIAKLQQRRKAMTTPSGKQPVEQIDMEKIIDQLKGQMKQQIESGTK